LEHALVQALWDDPLRHHRPGPFIEHYLQHRVLIDAFGLNFKRHRDLVDLIKFIKANTLISQEEVVAKLRADHGGWLGDADDSAEHAVEIAVRIWLMVSTDMWTGT
jgi:hypothetical protein